MNEVIHHGDCLEILRTLPAKSIDSLVTDPPAGISFMGKDWDSDRGGRTQWVPWMTRVMLECSRVLKPGAHALVWAIPRTSHWTATALEDAGFEVRDSIVHIFSTGFPKSLSVEKALEKAESLCQCDAHDEAARGRAPRESQSSRQSARKLDAILKSQGTLVDAPQDRLHCRKCGKGKREGVQGLGTAIKPAHEVWLLCRKPLSEKTVAANVLKHGTGALNIDGCRIGTEIRYNSPASTNRVQTMGRPEHSGSGWNDDFPGTTVQGRFPANLVLSHNHDCEQVGTKQVKATAPGGKPTRGRPNDGDIYGDGKTNGAVDYGNADGTETVPAWRCTEGCAVAALDRQSGTTKSTGGRPKSLGAFGKNGRYGNAEGALTANAGGLGDSGGASRFFYCAKASKRDRGEGNTHPTVKSTQLMRYLCRLITPPGGTVLDPFAGSGSTGVAALAEGFRFVGIEQEIAYIEIAERRLGEGL